MKQAQVVGGDAHFAAMQTVVHMARGVCHSLGATLKANERSREDLDAVIETTLRDFRQEFESGWKAGVEGGDMF